MEPESRDKTEQQQRKVDRLARRYAVLIKEVDIFEEFGLPGHQNAPEETETIDISPDGARLRCKKTFPQDALLKLELDIPDWERYDRSRVGGMLTYPSQPFSVLAKPVWSKDRGPDKEIGLRFVNIHDRHRRALKRLIENESGEPA